MDTPWSMAASRNVPVSNDHDSVISVSLVEDANEAVGTTPAKTVVVNELPATDNVYTPALETAVAPVLPDTGFPHQKCRATTPGISQIRHNGRRWITIGIGRQNARWHSQDRADHWSASKRRVIHLRLVCRGHTARARNNQTIQPY